MAEQGALVVEGGGLVVGDGGEVERLGAHNNYGFLPKRILSVSGIISKIIGNRLLTTITQIIQRNLIII